MRRFICDWLAWLLRIHRPSPDKQRDAENPDKMAGEEREERAREGREERARERRSKVDCSYRKTDGDVLSSRSLLANVLDLDDDFFFVNKCINNHYCASQYDNQTANVDVTKQKRHLAINETSFCNLSNGINSCCHLANHRTQNNFINENNVTSLCDGVPGNGAAFVDVAGPNDKPTNHNTAIQELPQPPSVMNATILPDRTEDKFYSQSGRSVALLREILHELRSLTEKVKQDDRRQSECSDWKFAALVIDRLCFVLFTFFTLASTVVILSRAPHILV